MHKIKSLFLFGLLLALLHGVVYAGTYSFIDGTQVSGDPISYDQKGVILKADAKVGERIPWAKFSQDSLKQLRDEAKTEKDKAFIEPLIEEEIQQKAKAKELNVKPVEHIERPSGKTGFFTLFSSPLGLFILLLIYGSTIYAAYEVARYKNIPPGAPCGLAAVPFLGILSPIIFFCVRPKTQAEIVHAQHVAEEAQTHEAAHYEPAAPEAAHYAAPEPQADAPHYPGTAQTQAAAQAPQQPTAPQNTVVTFKKGEFTFNRRFIETKFAGFLRAVPGEAEKDSVLYVKSLRGEFIGRKITAATPTDLVLQIFKGDVTADESIPYSELVEIQIRPKNQV